MNNIEMDSEDMIQETLLKLDESKVKNICRKGHQMWRLDSLQAVIDF
jgi:hypothetical protein